jgi:hypothetical protein
MRIQVYKGRDLINRGAPLIARVYKGEAKTDPKKPGRDTNYFRVEFEDSPAFDRQRAIEGFQKLYGKQPTTFRNVQFMTDSLELTFTNAMEEWRKSQNGRPIQWRKCDGETMFIHYQGNTCNRNPTPCQHECGCKPTGRLMFWLPEFTEATGILGQFMLITHSINDIQSIQSALDLAFNALNRLRAIAFVLYRRDTNITTPDGAPVTKSLVYLEMSEAAAQYAAIAASEAALGLTAGHLPALPAPNIIEAEVDHRNDEPLEGIPEGYDSSTWIVAVERRQQGQNNRYILETAAGHKITIFTREKFREAGRDVSTWEHIKGRMEIEPIGIVEEYDGQYWQLVSVVPLSPPPDQPVSPADQIPF